MALVASDDLSWKLVASMGSHLADGDSGTAVLVNPPGEALAAA